MKIKYTSIILALLIMVLIVSFTVIGCRNTINAPGTAATKAPATTAAPTTTQAK